MNATDLKKKIESKAIALTQTADGRQILHCVRTDLFDEEELEVVYFAHVKNL